MVFKSEKTIRKKFQKKNLCINKSKNNSAHDSKLVRDLSSSFSDAGSAKANRINNTPEPEYQDRHQLVNHDQVKNISEMASQV